MVLSIESKDISYKTLGFTVGVKGLIEIVNQTHSQSTFSTLSLLKTWNPKRGAINYLF